MSGVFVSSLLLAALLLMQFEFGVCLNCYQCFNVSNVTDCNHTVSCTPGASCYTDTMGEGDNTRYNLGCRDKEICRQSHSDPQSTLVGRAVTQKSTCSQCCGVNLCNRHICASGIHGLLTNQCADDPTFDCEHVSELFNVCNDKDHAKLVCRKFCDLCDIIDGYWLAWSSWSTCSQTCGYGQLTRTRACNRTDDGLPCTGDNSEHQQCFIKTCPVNGGWTAWSSWSGCTVTCGAGLERRIRHCSNPYPGPQGRSCDGDAWDDRICWRSACTDGVWTSWSNWGSCSASCQGGISIRRRHCNTTSLTSLGHSCVGNNEEYKVCNTQLCTGTVVDGGWTLWSSWSNCSAYCMSVRTRNCSNPIPSTYGKNCLGNSIEKKDCNLEYCTHSVRLVNGNDPYEGRLEVFHNGLWGTVCDDGFGNNEADVICRMLNYNGVPKAYQAAAFGSGTLPILLDGVSCSGSEESIFDCTHLPWTSNDCRHGEDVSVSCHTDLDVRLVNGTSNTIGRVEVSRGDNKWGTVCSANNVKKYAENVCNMLSITTNNAITYAPGFFGIGPSPSFMIDSLCSEPTANLGMCGHWTRNTSSCDHNGGVGVACVETVNARLVNGTGAYNGRVEVSINGNTWGSVCTRGYDSHDAEVICRTLGFPTNITIPYMPTFYGQGTRDNTLSYLSCSGNEGNLAQCPVSSQISSCSRYYDAGVLCGTDMNVRLVNGTNQHNGRVEISVDGGNWGTICDAGFDRDDARVICRMLGYPTNMSIPYSNGYFGIGTTSNILSNLQCSGSEQSLADCNSGLVNHCSPNNHVGLACIATIRARLVNGTNTHNGRVEVSLDGNHWGTVCDYNFDKPDAKVICNMLGYPSNNPTAYTGAHFGEGTQPYILPGLACSGNEKSLADCNMYSYYRRCGGNYVAGVACQ